MERAGSGKELLGKVNGIGLETVGSNTDGGDCVGGLVDREGNFHTTPRKLCGTLGLELLPASIFPVGRCKAIADSLHLGECCQMAKVELNDRAAIFFFKGIEQVRNDVLSGNDRVQLGEVDDSRGMGLDTMSLEFGGLDLEVFLKHIDIGADEDGAMMEPLMLTFGEGVARKFTAVAEEVVASRKFGLQTVVGHSLLEHRKLSRSVVKVVRNHKGEIEIAQVVEYGPTTGAATHEEATVILKEGDVALGIGILVLPDDHGATVCPEVEGEVAIGGLGKEILLNGNVEVRVGLGAQEKAGHKGDGILC